ncbi:MAG: response regulator [Syntrophorhabdaceae bacterium]|nr:response regulator [Syntrophorhabdaceae bacterium]
MERPAVRILLVDDDNTFRGIFAKFFARYPGFEIHEAGNGQEGLRKARDIRPDLILSDYDMPIIDGLEFCRQIRNTPETASVFFLFLTAEKDEKLKIQAFECGADDYIEKSTPPVILTSKIRAFLRIKQLQNELVDEKEKLADANQTLERNFKELTQILLKIIDVRVPGAADRAHAAREAARFICKKMGTDEEETDKILFGAQLHEIGKIGLPDTIADKSKNAMAMSDRNIYNQHPVIGSLIISTISGFKKSADAIYHQHENFDGTGTPEGLIGNEIPSGARILRGIVLQSDLCRSGYDRDDILREIRQSANRILDPTVASSLAEHIVENDREFAVNKCKIALDELKPGMVIAEDIYAASGVKLIPKHVKVQDRMLQVLLDRNDSDPIIGGVYVMIGKTV